MEYVVCSIAGCGLPGHQDGNRQFCKMNCPSGMDVHLATRVHMHVPTPIHRRTVLKVARPAQRGSSLSSVERGL